jgi:outer membrane protein assembly factor BamA
LGPQFHIGRVTFEGVSGLPLDDLRTEVALAEGADYRPPDVEEARNRLQSRYRREGFTLAAVEPRQQIRSADAAVDLTFIVEEGPRQVFSEVTVSGIRSVDEDVVMRALRLKVGDPLRTTDWLEARRRLFETGLFRRVDISLEPTGEPGATAPMRLLVSVEEWPALRVRYGFQVAEERPEEEVDGRDLVPGVSVDATRRTLFGRAIAIGGAAQYQTRERLGRVFMSTPTMLGWPVQSSLVLERSREEQRTNTLVTDTTLASWEQRARRGPLSVSYGLRFERNHTVDTAPVNPDFPSFDLTVHIARLTSSGTWDTRDDPADSARGTFASTSLEQGLGALGSDLLFVRSLSQFYHFKPWKGVALASAARFGIVQPLGGQEVLLTERFFAGGARTVRGVAEDSLGGVDFLGLPIGGEVMLVLNQEVRFPIHRWLRGVAFVDAGNVFLRPQDVDLGSLVVSGGVGLRFATPFALLRIDYGKTMWNSPTTGWGRWVFGLGQSF